MRKYSLRCPGRQSSVKKTVMMVLAKEATERLTSRGPQTPKWCRTQQSGTWHAPDAAIFDTLSRFIKISDLRLITFSQPAACLGLTERSRCWYKYSPRSGAIALTVIKDYPVKDSVERRLAFGRIRRAVFESGRELERSLRSVVKQLSPRRVVHNLRWHLSSQNYLEKWTEQRLQLDNHYWLFILGLNNSGTTLLVDLLKSHPAMRWLPNEGQYLTGALPLPRAYGVPRNFSRRPDIFHWTEKADPTPALRIQYDWALHFQQRPGILLEKSPPNILRSRWLQQNFRPSRFVTIIRHPYAVCEGIRRREGHTIEEATLHWVRSNELLLDDVKHLQYCLCVSYEELCLFPENHLEKLETFLGLDIPLNRSVLTTPRHIHNIDATPQLIRTFNERSVQQLSAADLAIIDRIAGPMMERLGYKPLPKLVCLAA
jgi:hypothetical protein